MKKRILTILLAVCIVLSLWPTGVLAAEATSGFCGDNLMWTLTNGTLRIFGTGNMTDYNNVYNVPWFYSKSSVWRVEIESGVTSIGKYAFNGCSNMTSISIPSGIESIEEHAFWSCSSLDMVIIPDSVTFIGDHAFYDCTGLEIINIPSSIKDIGSWAFANCSSLTNIILPDSIKTIGMNAFYNCKGLVSASISGGVTSINYSMFSNCRSLTSITIPQCVKSIKNDAFSGCSSLTDVYYSGSKTEWEAIDIGWENENLTSATIHYKQEEPATPDKPTNPDKPIIPDEPTIPTISFVDVSANEYYADAVSWAVSKRVTMGTTETTFSPNDPCTRAQAVTFLWRAAGSPEPKSTSNPFVDVSADQYYYKAVLWAVEQGITNGVSVTEFGPDATCNRAQIVTFLYRYEGAPDAEGSSFNDVPAGEYYHAPVLWAVSKGVTNGTDVANNLFSPMDDCTRAHIVTFLYRDMVG